MQNYLSSIKHHLKNIHVMHDANAFLKALLQERKALSEVRSYRSIVSRQGIVVPSEEMLASAIRGRCAQFSITILPKSKGTLNIFLAAPLHNWEAVLPKALEPFGKVTTFMWSGGTSIQHYRDWLEHRASLNREMLQRFHEEHAREPIDVVVGYLSDYNTVPETLLEMKRCGSLIFNMCWDDKLYFTGKLSGQRIGVASIAPVVDLNLTNAPDSVIKYAAVGALSIFWPEAALPDIHKPYDVPFEFDISFVGQKYGWRPKFIDKLRENGIIINCFGKGWDSGPLSDEEMVKLYSRSRINLGFAGVGHSKKLMCLKGRDFEVPMSGALYLTQDNPELSLVYDVGSEIMTYRDERDCVDKIKWILSHPEEADTIRRAGRQRALKDHTWERRFEDIFRLAGHLK